MPNESEPSAPPLGERDGLLARLRADAAENYGQFSRNAEEALSYIVGLESRLATAEMAVHALTRNQRLLAMLAAKEPQFFNPLVAMEAQNIRDAVLRGLHVA